MVALGALLKGNRGRRPGRRHRRDRDARRARVLRRQRADEREARRGLRRRRARAARRTPRRPRRNVCDRIAAPASAAARRLARPCAARGQHTRRAVRHHAVPGERARVDVRVRHADRRRRLGDRRGVLLLAAEMVEGLTPRRARKSRDARLPDRPRPRHRPRALQGLRALTPAAIAKHGGRFVVRGGAVTTLEGPPENDRVVVIEFPSVERAQEFWSSPEYARGQVEAPGRGDRPVHPVDGYAG